MYKVTFIVNESGVRVTKDFSSPYFANRFANKVKHSKKLTLVSCVGF